MTDPNPSRPEAITQRDVRLRVNGDDVPLNSFVTAIFASTIKGMIDALKLEKPPREISIHITFDRRD